MLRELLAALCDRCQSRFPEKRKKADQSDTEFYFFKSDFTIVFSIKKSDAV